MHIENEVRYQAAIERNIRANANTTRRRKWEAMDRYQEAYDFLNEQGQFEPTEDEDRGWITHPWVKVSQGKFYSAMFTQHLEWGGLSEKQHAAVVKMIDDAAQRIADREASFQAAAKASDHFGEVGQWYDEELTFIGRQFLYESTVTYYSQSIYKTKWKTSCGRTVFHKGALTDGIYDLINNPDGLIDEGGYTPLHETGTKMKVRFKVKAFDDYRGFKSTAISHVKPSKK